MDRPPPRTPPRPRSRPRATALALLFASAALAHGAGAPAQVLPHPPTVDRLPNGLTVVVLPYDTPGIAAYYTLVRTGSRDEVEPGHSGFAHLFEHMMFRGTRTVSASEYELRMQALGADNNAYTTEDFTMYTVTLPAASVPGLIPIEADRFQHLEYEEPLFQTETHAVLGEYNRGASSPLQHMWESLSETAFNRHTYGHTTLGYLRDIQAMPGYFQYSRQFFQRYYRPDNTTVIVAGDVQRDALVPLIRQHYGSWTGRRQNAHVPPEPEQRGPRLRALAWEGRSAPTIMIGYRTPAFSVATVDSAAFEVIHALAFSESSDLYQRLVVREQRLLSLDGLRGEFRRDPGLFLVMARLGANTRFEDVETAVTDELARIGRGDYPRDRIQSVISHLRYSLPMEVQTPSAAANTLGRFMALTGDVTALDRYHAQLQRVTPDDVARVARTHLIAARRSIVTLIEAANAPPGAIHVSPGGVQATTGSATAPGSSAAPGSSPAPATPAAPAHPGPAMPAGAPPAPAPRGQTPSGSVPPPGGRR